MLFVVGMRLATSGFGQEASAVIITNLAGLRQAVLLKSEVICEVRVVGTVCATSTSGRDLVLSDASGAELIMLEKGQVVRPGERIALTGSGCQLIRRDWGISITRPAIIDNDGLHGAAEKSRTISLAASRVPIRLEWFNSGEARELKLFYEGPNNARVRVPDDLLFCVEQDVGGSAVAIKAGLNYRCFEGQWFALPDFGSLHPVAEGAVKNFDLSVVTRQNNVALEFSGYLEVAQPGDYTFHLTSDDGARLFVGELLPTLETLGNASVPVPKQLQIGAVLNPGVESHWVEVEGVVRFVRQRAECAEIELESGQDRLRVGVLDREGLNPALLLNSRVRIRGVSRSSFHPDGGRAFELLAVASLRDVKICQLAAEIRDILPVTRIGDLSRKSALVSGRVVRLVGRIGRGSRPDSFVITDTTGAVPVVFVSDSQPNLDRQQQVFGSLVADGTNCFLECAVIEDVDAAPASKSESATWLTTAEQVQSLTRREAQSELPARIRGVIICDAPELNYGSVLQDGTRGLFFHWKEPLTQVGTLERPRLGEYWEIRGVTEPGQFAPVVRANELVRLGQGLLPPPVHPTWDQLMSGALDTQYVELTGIITAVHSNSVVLLTHGGKIRVELGELTETDLRGLENSLVRMRGCLLAKWDSQTHQMRLGEVRLATPTIIPSQSGSLDPFNAPQKSVADLLLYDLQAGAFQRVKMTGQISFVSDGEHFMICGTNGVRFVSRAPAELGIGDVVEVVGIPELGGDAPVLREAVARKLGVAPLPEPRRLGAELAFSGGNDATRVVIQARLVGTRIVDGNEILDLQLGGRSFSVRFAAGQQVPRSIAPGSLLEMTGVYVALGGVGRNAAVFELYVDSPEQVLVIARPPWWTPRRMLVVLGGLVAVLILAALWITQLRRRVAERTGQLQREIHEREYAERQRAVAEEKSRIARDLHDDLGSSLTEISLLANIANHTDKDRSAAAEKFGVIATKARAMVSALDVIVWAVDPQANNLQSMVDYVAGYVTEFLDASGIECRYRIPAELPEVMLDGRTRHELFLAVKEALNNVVRHAQATAMEFVVSAEAGALKIEIVDDGRGFDISGVSSEGHGVVNMQKRLVALGGRCHIQTKPGAGTRIEISLPIPT